MVSHGPRVFGQVSPGARRARDPQHGFDVPPPLVCRAASFGLRGLKQRTQLLPQSIGELGQSRQRDRQLSSNINLPQKSARRGLWLTIAALGLTVVGALGVGRTTR